MVLVDTYGRILTEFDSDGNFRTAIVWVPGDSRIDWDSASDTELVALLNKYGYNDALTIEAGSKNVIINTNDETETLVWDNTAMDFTIDFDQWQNGTANMFYRTVEVNSQAVTVLCDADGKAIRAPFGEYDTALFQVGNNGTEIDSITAGSSIAVADVITACGGATDVTNLNGGDVVELLVKGNYVQFINADNSTTTPSVAELPSPTPIAVAGAIQVFADENCTRYADGTQNEVYVRLNRSFGYNDAKEWGGYPNTGASLTVDTPNSQAPSNMYHIACWMDLNSEDYSNEFTAGQVVKCEVPLAYFDVVSNPQVIFRDE